MAKLPRDPYTLRVGTQIVVVQLPQFYDDIANYVGLTKLTGVAPADAGKGNVSNLLRDAQIARIRVSYKKVVGGVAKFRTQDIICDLDNYKTALGTLPNKAFRGSKIEDAYIPRRRRLG